MLTSRLVSILCFSVLASDNASRSAPVHSGLKAVLLVCAVLPLQLSYDNEKHTLFNKETHKRMLTRMLAHIHIEALKVT